jgi:hypothetical protein
LIGLLLSALNPFKMILFWGLKKFPLRREFPTLKDHLTLEVAADTQRIRVSLRPRRGGNRSACASAAPSSASSWTCSPGIGTSRPWFFGVGSFVMQSITLNTRGPEDIVQF